MCDKLSPQGDSPDRWSRLTDKLEEAEQENARLRKDCEGLNQMIRDHQGQGQGAIDTYVAQCEELDAITAEIERLKERLDPEELKAVLRQVLSGCGPMAIVYAEAAINEMAGIESPREE